MPATISPKAVDQLKKRIDERARDTAATIPGMVFCAVNRDGDLIFSHASGTTGMNMTDPMALDTVFWMASFTKMITGIACMQMVEQGKLALDDVALVERLAPELKDVKVLEKGTDKKYHLVEKKRGITLRMLLAHTAGFGYAFEDEKLADWARPAGLDDFDPDEVLSRPLVNQPGERFQYGTNVDWAGILVERVSHLSLDEYFKKYIFEPLELNHITFFPTPEMKGKMARMHQRAQDGTLREIDHLFRRPLLVKTREEKRAMLNSGGCGCFGRPDEYCQIIATLLNDGTNAKTKAQLLKPETVKDMFVNQIPDKPRRSNIVVPVAKPHLANATPLFPMPDDHVEGWGLTFSLDLRASDTGRAAGAGSWEGLPNLFWFADREYGVGAIIAAQLLPYGGE